MKRSLFIFVFLSGLLLDIDISSFSFTFRMQHCIFATDPMPTELYHCIDEITGEVYESSLPCDFDGGTKSCAECWAQMEYFEDDGGYFLCPNMLVCGACGEYCHMSSHDCPNVPNNENEDDEDDEDVCIFLRGGGINPNGEGGSKNPCVCCSKCHSYPCKCNEDSKNCSVCHQNPCICNYCKTCHKNPCVCHLRNPEQFRQVTDSIYKKWNSHEYFKNHACCNYGVKDAFQGMYGFLPSELDCIADSVGRALQKNLPCRWHVINYSEANEYANKGFFVMFCSPAIKEADLLPGETKVYEQGHMCTILPEYTGEKWSDIHVMDTGYWCGIDKKTGKPKNTRAIDQTSFGYTIGTSYMQHGKFYYYDPSECNNE